MPIIQIFFVIPCVEPVTASTTLSAFAGDTASSILSSVKELVISSSGDTPTQTQGHSSATDQVQLLHYVKFYDQTAYKYVHFNQFNAPLHS